MRAHDRAAYLRAIQEAVTPDDLQSIVQAIVIRARSGDVQAASLIIDRLLGRPSVHVDITQRPSLSDLRARVASMLSGESESVRRMLGPSSPKLETGANISIETETQAQPPIDTASQSQSPIKKGQMLSDHGFIDIENQSQSPLH